MQLARDYLAAGLFDRAEELFLKIIDEPEHRSVALTELIVIYEQTKEWEKAIIYAGKLKKLGDPKVARKCAHFYCELAIELDAFDDVKKKNGYLKKALQQDRLCTRASILLAHLHMDLKEYKRAIEWFEHILAQDVDFITEVLQPLKECYSALDDEAGFIHFLNDAQSKKAGISVSIQLAEYTNNAVGSEPAEKLMHNQIVRHPTMKGFYQLMNYHSLL